MKQPPDDVSQQLWALATAKYPYDTSRRTSTSPEFILFGSREAERASEALSLLVEASDFTQDQTERLLNFFSEEHDTVPTEIEELLDRLRAIALKSGILA